MANTTRVPSAGFSQGFAFVVLTDPGQRRMFWETTSGPAWRGESESVSLTRAPVVILPLAHKQAYLDRYALPDKAHTPLSSEEQWPAPFWDIDTGFGVMMILLTRSTLAWERCSSGYFRVRGPHGCPRRARGLPAHRRHCRRHPTRVSALGRSCRVAAAPSMTSCGGSAGDNGADLAHELRHQHLPFVGRSAPRFA